MQIEFRGKVVLITGAAGAIGKGIAQKMKSAGADLFITDLKRRGSKLCAKRTLTEDWPLMLQRRIR